MHLFHQILILFQIFLNLKFIYSGKAANILKITHFGLDILNSRYVCVNLVTVIIFLPKFSKIIVVCQIYCGLFVENFVVSENMNFSDLTILFTTH